MYALDERIESVLLPALVVADPVARVEHLLGSHAVQPQTHPCLNEVGNVGRRGWHDCLLQVLRI